jgi:flagellar biosynthesis/type III secretory pathway protein FliH
MSKLWVPPTAEEEAQQNEVHKRRREALASEEFKAFEAGYEAGRRNKRRYPHEKAYDKGKELGERDAKGCIMAACAEMRFLNWKDL